MAFINLIGQPIFRVIRDNLPVSGAKVYTYASGTSTPITTYTDAERTTANANPIVCDSNGECIIYGDGTGTDIKVILHDSDDVLLSGQSTIDPIPLLTVTDAGRSLIGKNTKQLMRNYLELGTAALEDVASDINAPAAGDVLQMNNSGYYPVGDGRNITNLAVQAVPMARSCFDGLSITRTNGATSITIAAGRVRDDGDAANIVLSSSMAKSLNSTWTAGSGNGGLDSGTIAAADWYYVFVIRNATSEAVDVIFASSLSPTMPSGYTQKRYIGAFKTASSQVVGATQIGDWVLWQVPVLDVDALSISTTTIDLTLPSVPDLVRVKAKINVRTPATSGNEQLVIHSSDMSDIAPSTTAAPLGVIQESCSDAVGGVATMEIFTSSGVIRARASASGQTIYVATIGYKDRRGKDD